MPDAGHVGGPGQTRLPSGEVVYFFLTYGAAWDERIVKVVVHTNKGRELTAKMYRRFWFLREPALGADEEILKIEGRAADGKVLHEVSRHR